MKNFSKLLALVMMLAIVAVLALPALAQDDEGFGVGDIPIDDNTPGAGEGGVVVYDNSGGDDPQTFNPLVGGDTTSSAVYDFLYPSIFAINPLNGLSEPNQPGGLATGWEFNEDGTQVTITLRQDAFWSDGTQITAADYIWSTTAIRSGEIDSPRTSMFETLADGTPAGGKISSIEATDDFTVVVTFAEPDCIAFEDINDAAVVPAHVFADLYDDDLAAMNEEPRRIPEVTFGPFYDLEFDPGQRVSLLANQEYPDAYAGYVVPEEWVYLSVPNTDVATERFIAGDISILGVPSTRQEEFRTDPNLADFQTFEFTGNGFSFFAMNWANPDNPLPALDEEGNLIEQDPHPVLGDVRVRQAITQAVDVASIIENIRDGNGIQVATHTIPTSWVYNPDLQYVFDPDAAMALLDEAGWIDDDGDASTPRVCSGCLHAEEGATLSIRIRVPEGSESTTQTGEFFAASLDDIGFDADFAAIDWGSAFLPELTGQTFDLALLAWSLGLPVDPDVSWAYGPEVDVPGSGFNFGSFYNEELNELMAQGRSPSATNGCDQDARREIYLRAQEILFDEVPYMYLWVAQSMTAAQPNLINWNPSPYSRTYSIDGWALLDQPE
ncbi:MAG: ABC transporter substrate-binding protein [Aggregatilineales bacterium]